MNEKNLTIALFALLERENTVSIPQIAQMLGTSEEVVWALLEELVFAYDSVDLRLELNGAFASLQRRGTSRMLRLSENETNVLLDSLEAYGFGADSDLAQKLARTKGFWGSEGTGPGRMRTAPQGVNPKVAEVVAAACEDEQHHALRIEYQKEGAAAPEEREVEPLRIVVDSDHSVLEAFDPGRGGWRSFRLDRIRGAEVVDRTFAPKPFASGRTGNEALLRFAPGAMPANWPGLKKARTLDDGRIEARIPWYGTMWLPKRVVSMLGDAEALEPPELRAACARYAADLLE